MDAEREVEGWLALEPTDVRAGLGGADVEEIAIEIETCGIFARPADEAGGVENGTNKPRRAVVEKSRFKERQQRERRGWFVSVHARGKINTRALARRSLG